MEEQKPYMMSLYEYLGRAAGPELGKEVAETAVKLKETIEKRFVTNTRYNVCLYVSNTWHKSKQLNYV